MPSKKIAEMKPALGMEKRDIWKGWKKRIMVGVPTTGNLRIEWCLARWGQIIPCNWSMSDIFQFFDQHSPVGWAVADARNICVQRFIEQGFEWLFFIDHDTIPPQRTFTAISQYMNDAKYPMISGLYYCKGTHPEPLLFRGRGTGSYLDWKRGDKVWVDGVPMGMTLIHGSLIKRLYETSPAYEVKMLGATTQCRRVFETPGDAWKDPETGMWAARVGTEDLFLCDRIMKEKVFEKCGDKRWAKFQKKQYPFLVDTSIFCQHIDENGTQYPLNVGIA